jgi:YHS domain-containing protein
MMLQTSKQILTMIAMVLPLFGLVTATTAPVRAQSAVTYILTDPLTGVAIGGMDPVSYFTEPAPLPGKADFEYEWKGVPWYFANAANREIFMRDPELYAPQYGGHGAMSMARGFVSDADPQFFTVFKQRLFFFYSAANREAFLLAPDAAAQRGAANWQELSKTLTLQ